MNGRAPVPESDDELRRIEIKFMAAYERGEAITDWIERYPEHALALTDLAIALDLNGVDTPEQSSEEGLAAAAAALRRARDEVVSPPPSPSSPGLVARARSLGLSVPQLAREIRLASDILFKLDQGLIWLDTVPKRLLTLIAAALKLPVVSLPGSLVSSQPVPALYHAQHKPKVGEPQSFVEALAQSGAITDEDRAAWLAIARDEGLVA